MKKIILILTITSILFTGCGKAPEPEPEAEHKSYFTSGRYYTSGEVITNDGNIWGYTQDIISEKPSYNNEPVIVAFDDMGTPDNIYDDEILGLVLDRETAIYDELEEKLSEKFVVERDGNNIKLNIAK